MEPPKSNLAPQPAGELDSRMRIVRAAYPLFVEFGYDSVSMQLIADSVPIHKATIYHHFSSKENLFVEVVRIAFRRLHEQVEAIMAEGGGTAVQLARVAFQIFHDSDSDLGRLMSDVNQHLTIEQRQGIATQSADPWSLYQQIFIKAIAAGEIPPMDPALATSMFVGLLQGQAWSLKVGKIEPPLDEARAQLIVDVLLAGIATACAPSRSQLALH